MTKRMLIDAQHADETRVVISDDDHIEDFDFVTASKAQLKGNIYLAKITRVEPSLQAAFVEYGGGKQGFLPFSEIHPDYYQIPMEDKQRLIAEEEAETAREEAEEEEELAAREHRPRRGGRGRRGRGRNRRYRKDTDEQNEEMESAAESAETTASEDTPPPPLTDDLPDDEAPVDYLSAEIAPQEVASEPVDVDPEEEEEQEEVAEEDVVEEAAAKATEREEASDTQETNEAAEETDSDEEEDEDDNNAETISDDDIEETRRRRKGASFKRYKIQEVIKRNQIVLVQVIKEERGNKGVSLTTYISLAGRYCVLMPNSPKAGGVSRKIGNGEQRKKLKEVVAELKESRGLSAIVRTAGLDRTKTEIKRDYEYLAKLWSQIRDDTLASTAPALIYEESDIIKRSIRDLYSSDVEQVIVQGEHAYKDAKSFMRLIMPSHAPRVKHHKESQPIFSAYNIETQLATMFEPSAKLPSGGSIVLQQTEALISIDVNSGRSTTERNVEETAIKTNLEAAREVARQLRLRDLAGLIVVDFIDMNYGKNRRNLERAMKDALKLDRAKIQVSRISPFGLMELSRQRLRPSIAESSGQMCPHCKGSGFIQSVETIAIQIIRVLEREAATGEFTALKVFTQAEAALHLLNERRDLIRKIEEEYGVTLIINIDHAMITGEFRIMKTTEDGKEIVHREEGQDNKRRNRRGRRGGRSRNRQDDENDSDTNNDSNDDDTEEAKERKPRRGGRRRKKEEGSGGDDATTEASDDDASKEKKSYRGGRRRKLEDTSDDGEKKSTRGKRGGTRTRRKKLDEPKPESTAEEPHANEQADVISFEDQPKESAPASAEETPPASTSNETANEASKPKRRGWWNKAEG